jgi:cytosine/adenosine deaminase-related metal-dependent hydrolase
MLISKQRAAFYPKIASARRCRAASFGCRPLVAAFVLLGVALCFAPLARASLLVANATFLTMKPGETAPVVGYMLVADDGRIAALAPGAPPVGMSATATLDATNKIIIPGFISAHSHIWQSALRGLGADQYTPGWIRAVQVYSSRATDEDLYWFTLHGALDHLQHGITSAYNFGYNVRIGEYNADQLRALLASGIRFVHAFAQPRSMPVDEHYQGFARFYSIAKPHLSDPKLLRLGFTGLRTTLAEAKLGKRLMDEFGVLNQTHYLEAPLDTEQEQKLFQNFIDAGSLGPNLYFGHFIHTTDEILQKSAAAGSGMSWQPLSNGRLASGIADIPKYRSFGVKVGMGVDGQASADVADAFENMRVGLYLLRAKYQNPSIMQPIEILGLHTMGSAEVMGVADKIGSLEVGKLADFNVISVPTPVFDPAATVVFACSTMNLDAVYVGGEKLVDHAVLTRSDMAKAASEVETRVGRIRALAGK